MSSGRPAAIPPSSVSISTKPPPVSNTPVRFIPLTYDNAESEASALRLCLALLPPWERDAGEVKFTRFTDGITNTLLKASKKRPGASDEEVDADAVLIRAYGTGTEVLIDREREAAAQAVLAEKGLAPPLLARFHNGILYRFTRGAVCTPADFRNPTTARAIARRLGEWHARLPVPIPLPPSPTTTETNGHSHANGTSHAQPNGQNHEGADADERPAGPPRVSSAVAACAITPGMVTPNMWTVMQRWVFALPQNSPAERERKEQLQAEIERTTAELVHLPGIGDGGLVLSHCDLLSGNVIRLGPSKTNPEEEDVGFIDYEYTTPAPAAFDLANHFGEYGGFDCDFTVLPTRSARRAFLDTYLATYRRHREPPTPPRDGHDSADADLDELCKAVDRFRGVPGLYWGIWGLIQATISQIDFDYAAYAEIRLGEYWAWREEEDGSRAREGRPMSVREKRWAEE